MIYLPIKFVKTIKDVHKEKGEKWLLEFQELIHECEERWHLKIMPPFDLSYNFVAPAIRNDGLEVVIKLTVPSEEFLSEVEALVLFNDHGMVRIVDVDRIKGVLLLERLKPGTTLASLENNEEAAYIASQVMKKLWSPAPKSVHIPHIKERGKSLDKIYKDNPEGLGPITKEMLQEATENFRELAETQTEPFLLHGDLHHYNILRTGTDSWLAIDPKGLIGEREYDVIQFLLNKLPDDQITEVIEKRIDIFVKELNLDKNRILLYGFSHAVLATCWSIQDSGTWDEGFFKAIYVFKDLRSY
ncbi:aminoglycoside phosphotransferase family protein [Bacillus sp. JJ1532]|uniref:aminoglycoside phosphotransferase family protein n=1 Tax=unclassified Bacillus (in: firmicutes) TaxID=185979 RepID=UPI002FFE139E